MVASGLLLPQNAAQCEKTQCQASSFINRFFVLLNINIFLDVLFDLLAIKQLFNTLQRQFNFC